MDSFILVLATVILFTRKCDQTRSDSCVHKGFFVKKAQNAVLKNHVIAEYQVASEIHCAQRCMRECRCVSFNYGYTRAITSELHVCQISDEKKQNDIQNFTAVDEFSYFEFKPPFCDASSCQNGGKCLQQHDDQQKCMCAEGYNGSPCEHKASTAVNATSCSHSPCKNNASCVKVANGFSCICQEAFHGKTCEKAESCLALRLTGEHSDGLHQIHLTNIGSVQVLCDQKTDGGGWTVIQRRTSPFSLKFDKNWTEYESGFGNLQGEFWLGNKIIYNLMKTPRVLRIELKTNANVAGFAEYPDVTVDAAQDKYRIKMSGGFRGNIGDCGGPSSWQHFTTKDSDNDANNNKNCADEDHAGWWYKNCGCGNLNRQSRPKWDSWYISNSNIAFSEIKIR